MRSAKSIVASHCLLGLLMCSGNLYFAVQRSLIPISLTGHVTDRETRFEKHRGKDDVYLLTLETGRAVQVDQAIFGAVGVGDEISKVAWSSQLRISSREMELGLSRDARGMLWAMPAAIMVILAASVWAIRLSRLSANPTASANLSTAE